MLYALVGNGDPNKREVLESLKSLKDAVEEKGGEFWMLLCEESDPSPALREILSWLNESTYYEMVRMPSDEAVHPLYKPEHVHLARRPVDRMVTIVPQRVQADEQYALLVMSDDIDTDDECLYAINKSIDLGIPVLDLGGQMVPLVLEDADHQDEVVAEATTASTDEFTREDLESLTLAELKAHVKSAGVTPTDLRSKESIIDALLGEDSPVPSDMPEPEGSAEPDRQWYFLTIVRADGSAEMRPLSPSQAALVG